MKRTVVFLSSLFLLSGCANKSSEKAQPSASKEHVVGQCSQRIFDYQRFSKFKESFDVLKEKNPRKIIAFDFDQDDGYTCKYSISVFECGEKQNTIQNKEYEKAWFLFDFEKKHYEESNGAEKNLSAEISFNIENTDSIESFEKTKITFEQNEKDSYAFYYDKAKIFDAKTVFGYSMAEKDKTSFLNSLIDKAVYLS